MKFEGALDTAAFFAIYLGATCVLRGLWGMLWIKTKNFLKSPTIDQIVKALALPKEEISTRN